MSSRLEDYTKAVKVVLSIKNMDHYASAKQYLTLFFEKHTLLKRKSGLRVADAEIQQKYTYLLGLLNIKRKQIVR